MRLKVDGNIVKKWMKTVTSVTIVKALMFVLQTQVHTVIEAICRETSRVRIMCFTTSKGLLHAFFMPTI